MLLDRIEIDSHGPLNRVELGPLSHHLNVVLGAPGSGKTAIGRFIRDSLIDRDYPRGMLSGSAGRVVWVHQNGWIHCRREQDGSPGGRRSVEFESRGETAGTWDGYTDGWFAAAPMTDHRTSHGSSGTSRPLQSSLAARTLGNIRLPESIVDGVLVDTTISSVSRVVAACISAGLDQANLAPLSFESETAHYNERGIDHHPATASPSGRDDHRRRALREELADIEAELGKLFSATQGHPHEVHRASEFQAESTRNSREIESLRHQRTECIRRRDALLARRSELRARRDQESQDHYRYRVANSHHPDRVDAAFESTHARSHWMARDARLRSLHQRADSLRSRASALQRWIGELDSQDSAATSYRYGAAVAVDSGLGSVPFQPAWQSDSAEQLQNRIRQADQEIVSLRRILADVQSLRDLLSSTGRSTASSPESYDWLDDGSLRGRRYDHFVRAMDHYSSDRPWSDFYASAYRPLRPVDDLAIRIESTTRHLDWLLSQFERPGAASATHSIDSESWRVEGDRDGMIEQSLRRVRDQLRRRDYARTTQMDPIIADLNQTLDRLLDHRRRVVAALASHPVGDRRDYVGYSSPHPDWFAERQVAMQELASVEQELHIVLEQTAVLRRAQRFLPILDPVYPIGMGSTTAFGVDTDLYAASRADSAWQTELRSIDAEIADRHRHVNEIDQRIRGLQTHRSTARVYQATPSTNDITRLQRRREELIAELNRCRPLARPESSLSELASRWLVRLSNGRHRLMRWSTVPIATDRYTTLAAEIDSSGNPENAPGRSVHVSIDKVDDRNVSAATRAVAALAVRLAAGELLGRMGHAIPLVLETHRELFAEHSPQQYPDDLNGNRAFQQWTCEGMSGDSIASALADYSAAGRQLLILTEHTKLANHLQRCGARHFALHTQRIVHPHRPMWRGGQRQDSYTGPHPISMDGTPSGQPSCEHDMNWTEAGAVNREFDQAWRQSAGLRTQTHDDAHATDIPAAGAAYRDGYYYADQSSTVAASSTSTPAQPAYGGDVAQSLTARHHGAALSDVDDVPFFLTVDSPIDAAPSIDAVAAQRLRRIGISHITHLMNQDSNRLADTLGLAGVDARTIRRWQAECRLMCRVPQLRGFDARVLVGCGITDPAQLAAIHPTDLLDRVKTFLATERGQRILLSGTSYELSRITSWIASANDSVHTSFRNRTVDGRRVRTRVVREESELPRRSANATVRTNHVEHDEDVYLTDDDFDQERYEVQVERRADQIVDDLDELTRQYDAGSDSQDRTGAARNHRDRSAPPKSTAPRPASYRMNSEAKTRTRRAERNMRRQTERNRASQGQRDTPTQIGREGREQTRSIHRNESSTKTTLRFYLERGDDVVDAPSIGPRMAERLNKIGVVTVDDLLNADAADIAESLNHRRIETDTVIQWQQQTTLVCRVPMLRGHDAQFLVAAGVTTAEDLAKCEAAELFELVDAVAQSTEGKRIARGGALPDLVEVSQWIECATQHRPLRAA